MSRSLSTTLKAQINGQNSNDPLIPLIEISHADITTLRFADNGENITSNSNTYNAFPFNIAIPNDTEKSIPRVTLAIDNVDRQLVQAVRSITAGGDYPDVKLSLVLASTPDTVEASFDFKLKSASYDRFIVSGVLSYEDILSESFPQKRFTPDLYPGIF